MAWIGGGGSNAVAVSSSGASIRVVVASIVFRFFVLSSFKFRRHRENDNKTQQDTAEELRIPVVE